MPPVSQAVLLSWSVPPAATLALVFTALLYLRGWILLRRAGVPFLPPWRAASFLLGLLSLWIALASPLDTFSGFVITAHMLQHMMLMMVAPPLILLGAPLIPLVRGLPVFAAREFAGPFLNWRVATRIGNALIHPLVALLLMGVVMFAWHTPRLYELALASSSWHEVEHACFFLASLVFWWPVIQPWPSRVALAALGDGAVFADRRSAKHGPVGDPGPFRPRDLSVVCDDAAPLRLLRTSRPVCRRRDHVGDRRVRLRLSCVCHRRSVSPVPAARPARALTSRAAILISGWAGVAFATAVVRWTAAASSIKRRRRRSNFISTDFCCDGIGPRSLGIEFFRRRRSGASSAPTIRRFRGERVCPSGRS